MKSMMTRAAVMVFGVAALVTAGARAAQAAPGDDTIVAKVPFAFVVNGVELPAGDYVVTRDANQPELVAIATADGERKALTLTRASGKDTEASAQPKLEFERIGKQVFLTQITLGLGISREIPLPVPAPGEDAEPRR